MTPGGHHLGRREVCVCGIDDFTLGVHPRVGGGWLVWFITQSGGWFIGDGWSTIGDGSSTIVPAPHLVRSDDHSLTHLSDTRKVDSVFADTVPVKQRFFFFSFFSSSLPGGVGGGIYSWTRDQIACKASLNTEPLSTVLRSYWRPLGRKRRANTYIHTYIHTDRHTYTHIYVHTHILTYIHT